MDASTKGLINFQQAEKIQWKVWEEKRKKTQKNREKKDGMETKKEEGGEKAGHF